LFVSVLLMASALSTLQGGMSLDTLMQSCIFVQSHPVPGRLMICQLFVWTVHALIALQDVAAPKLSGCCTPRIASPCSLAHALPAAAPGRRCTHRTAAACTTAAGAAGGGPYCRPEEAKQAAAGHRAA
jgi:hypothetical protein